LVIAVASLTTVAFFADRVNRALGQEASQLLGADLVVVSDRPIDAALRGAAERLGLRTVETVRFPSMTIHGDTTALTQVKAVAPGYPLKGRISVREQAGGATLRPERIPEPGTVWVDDRLFLRLGVGFGDSISVGERDLRIVAQVIEDP